MKQTNHNDNNNYCRGNALLSTIFFALIAITIATASIVMISVSILSASKVQLTTEAYSVAESGTENAVLRLLRDPSYTGEVLSFDNGVSISTVSGSGPFTITTEGRVGSFVRTIEVQLGYTNNILSITSWKEITQ